MDHCMRGHTPGFSAARKKGKLLAGAFLRAPRPWCWGAGLTWSPWASDTRGQLPLQSSLRVAGAGGARHISQGLAAPCRGHFAGPAAPPGKALLGLVGEELCRSSQAHVAGGEWRCQLPRWAEGGVCLSQTSGPMAGVGVGPVGCCLPICCYHHGNRAVWQARGGKRALCQAAGLGEPLGSLWGGLGSVAWGFG